MVSLDLGSLGGGREAGAGYRFMCGLSQARLVDIGALSQLGA
jgi:hypothetical protein